MFVIRLPFRLQLAASLVVYLRMTEVVSLVRFVPLMGLTIVIVGGVVSDGVWFIEKLSSEYPLFELASVQL